MHYISLYPLPSLFPETTHTHTHMYTQTLSLQSLPPSPTHHPHTISQPFTSTSLSLSLCASFQCLVTFNQKRISVISITNHKHYGTETDCFPQRSELIKGSKEGLFIMTQTHNQNVSSHSLFKIFASSKELSLSVSDKVSAQRILLYDQTVLIIISLYPISKPIVDH